MRVLLKGESSFRTFTKKEFLSHFGLTWTDTLLFQTPAFERKVRRKSLRAMKKKELSVEQKWLSVHFQKEIQENKTLAVSIRWIDETLHYGVFAEEEIAPKTYLGEYTGIVRKRTPRKDRKNQYCFEYSIGDWIYNPFLIDARETGNFTRFINHSDTPNLTSMAVYVDGIIHIIFVSEQKICKGAQLAYHYGDTFWKKRRRTKVVQIS